MTSSEPMINRYGNDALVELLLTAAKRDYKRELDKLLIEGPPGSQCFSVCTIIRQRYETRCDRLGDDLRCEYIRKLTEVEEDAVAYFHRRMRFYEFCNIL